MEIKILRSWEGYQKALFEIESLIDLDPEQGTEDAERLELLTLLIQDFEKRKARFERPDPISAIKFRMQEQGLRQKDLVPLIGSRSRVSEVVSGSRPLTVRMIRNLSDGLGISADALVGSEQEASKRENEFSFIRDKEVLSRLPIKEMSARGWLDSFSNKKHPIGSADSAALAFLQKAASTAPDERRAFLRQTFQGCGANDSSYYSILAWTARARVKAAELVTDLPTFSPNNLSIEKLRRLTQLSKSEQGALAVIRELKNLGILVIVEPKLSGTLVDGASMLLKDSIPVVALTLRYNRIDYFWFTLMHELVHVWKHLNHSSDTFVDRLEAIEGNDKKEKEANKLARDILIPTALWKRSAAHLMPSKKHILDLAESLAIHPAIVAGRLQFESGRYDIFREFVDRDKIKFDSIER